MNHTRAQKPTNGHERNFYSSSTARTIPCPDCHRKKPFQPHDPGGGYCHKCDKNFPLTDSKRRSTNPERSYRPVTDVAALWAKGIPVYGCRHGYLRRKGGLTGFRLRRCRNNLLVPIRLVTNELVSIQTIKPTGEKKFVRGCRLGDGFFSVGKLERKIFICEGVATALTIYTATREFTVAAMNAGRLLRVAKIIRKAYPDAEIIICADDDGD